MISNLLEVRIQNWYTTFSKTHLHLSPIRPDLNKKKIQR
jgi:hypothetical protein